MKHLLIQRDGDQYFVTTDEFTNLQESTDFGFGTTMAEAVNDLAKNSGRGLALEEFV